MSGSNDARRDQLLVAAAFCVAILAAAAFVVEYVRRAQTQWEGVFLATAFASFGAGLVWWAHRLLNLPDSVDHRHRLPSKPAERHEVVEAVEADGMLERRPALRRMMLAAGAALAAAAIVPFRSLGPRPRRSTPWREGVRLVDERGQAVNVADVPVDSLVTVFPEGHLELADAPTLLMRVDPRFIAAATGREKWSPEGLLAFSKICTHAGCPVGLYQAQSMTLLCPCHQSVFDVTRGATPTSGPAGAPLPQLPLRITDDGQIVAAGEFSAPVGPPSWSTP